jgi:CubicO group peptidase (beta-lactamase class C family)
MKTVSLVFIVLLVVLTACAQDKTPDIDKVFSWATPTAPGCVCAVSQHGKVVVNRAYGSADLEREVPLNTNSLFDIGSLMKQFVAAGVLILVQEGKLSLSDDVRKYIPELPDYGHKITIDNLITHTSGIRDWTGLLPLAPKGTDVWDLILRQRGLNMTPGDEWSYSSSGFVLAREVVARVSGLSFSDFARKRMFDPLGMNATSFREDLRAIIKNRALAYDREITGWRAAMLLDNNRAGGGILSTASDLLIWNEALTNNRLGKFVSEKLQEPTVLNNGRKLRYGRGLFIDTHLGTSEIAHTGSADGYKSYLGRFPEYGLSIAITCNSGDGTNRRNFAYQIVDIFVPEKRNLPTETGEPPIPKPEDTIGLNLNAKTGQYFNEKTGEPLQLAVDRGRLRVAGGPGFVPIGKDRFKRFGSQVMYMSQDEFELHFTSNDHVQLKTMEGKIIPYRRAQSFAPTTDQLKNFVGRYGSDELGSVFVVSLGKNGLVVNLANSPNQTLPLKPVDTDAFQISRMIMRFVRDKNGKVISLDYSNPVVKNIKFTRLHDDSARR